MRAPYSKLAKEILDNPETAKQLKNWLASTDTKTTFTMSNKNKEVKRIIAHRIEAQPTHDDETKRRWWHCTTDALNNFLSVIINPFSR